MTTTGLRVAAVGIAAFAVLDPAVTSTRRTKPFVSVEVTASDRALGDEVAKTLARQFTVVRGHSDLAAATVFVGALDESRYGAGPAFGVVRSRTATDVRIVRLNVPDRPTVSSRIPVEVVVAAKGASGRDVVVDLSIDEVVVAQESASVRSDSSLAVVRLSFVPAAGSQSLRAIARIATSSDTVFSQVPVNSERLPVLFYDVRPSWSSTFVRRAIESDVRFSVVDRIQTSRGIANTSGRPPASLRDADALRDFAAIVVGAPDLLTNADVVGLEAFMRRRGGRVVLLMDAESSSSIERLTGAPTWRVTQSAAPLVIADAEGGQRLRARGLVWPAILPTGAATLASSVGRDSTTRPAVWSVPVGAGRLVVSGARDAWHYRADSAGFDAFWRSTIAGQTMASPAPIDIELSRPVLMPGEEATVRVTVRETFLGDQQRRSSRVRATWRSATDSAFVRLWPERTPGVFSGRLIAPRDSGVSELVVDADGERASLPVVVDSRALHPRPDERSVLEAFVSSRGGRVVEEQDLASVPELIASAVHAVRRVERWHPMRSVWWLVPFVLLLGAEWWWRRRRGLA